MNCAYHHDREVRGICSSCGRPVCEECLVDLNGAPYCKTCLIVRVQRPAREINGFIRFVLSVAPGVGHLYMGLINRGLQFFMGTVLGGIVLGMLFPGLLGLYIPAAIFFSIFDAREVHLRLAQGLDVEDKGFVDMKAMPFEWNQKHVGYGLVALGGLALWRVMFGDMLRLIFPNQWYHIRDMVNGMTLGVIAILAGVWLLKRNSSSQS
ncbi:MAG: B-box zinc finger protein [Bacillota bacterium]